MILLDNHPFGPCTLARVQHSRPIKVALPDRPHLMRAVAAGDAQVLEVLIRYPEGGRITRISYGVGVPVDRLRNILEALSSYGLTRKLTVDDQTLYFATSRGMDFLETYWKMKGFLETFKDDKPSEHQHRK